MVARVRWDPRRLPDLSGRRYLVTGSTAGLGFFSALQLAGAGAHVVMTGRSPHRLATAKAVLQRQVADAEASGTVETLLLDTSNLGSVRAAAATARTGPGLDGLLLNAGIVHAPRVRTAVHGREIVLATNALGHYALAGEMLPALAARRGRMVWIGSMSTSLTPFDPVDPNLETGYSSWRAYVQSKVITSALGFEADRRLRAERVPVASLVAHPGYAIRGRTRGIAGVNEPGRLKRFVDNLQTPFSHSKEHGAWTLVRALTDPDAEGGQFWGPGLIVRGAPRLARPAPVTLDAERGERLWQYCEQTTRVRWPFARLRGT